MRLALAAILAFAPLAISAAPPTEQPQAGDETGADSRQVPAGSVDDMNRLAARDDCRSFDAQIADASRRRGGTRLDRQPPGYAFLAVDRHVGDCHQVTFVSDREARSEGR